MRIVFGFCTALALLAMNSARADTFCVNPAGGSCETTIQDAVDAAALTTLDPGEVHTIAIKAATYKESVVVSADPDLAGLIIKGSGKAIIDPAASVTAALTVNNNNVSVIGLSVNNVNNTGIVATGNFLTLNKVTCNNTVGPCAFIDGDDAILTGNKVFSSGSNGFHIEGNSALVAKNKFSHVGGSGVALVGNLHTVESNTCTYVSSCVVTDPGSNNIALRKNKTVEHRGVAYAVEGADALFEGNSAVAGRGVMIDVLGSNPRLLANKSKNGGGIELECITNCSTALVERNSVVSAEDGECFFLNLVASGTQILGNSAKACGGDGFEIRGAGSASVQGNKAAAVGFAQEDGFQMQGTGVKTLLKNAATLSGGDGFDVDEGTHSLEANKATRNGQDGFNLDGDTIGLTMTGNTATANIQEGFDNRGDGNIYEANKASGNREGSDFCDAGTGTILVTDAGGDDTNKFKSTGDSCVYP